MIWLKTKNLIPKTDSKGIALYIVISITAALILVSYGIVESALKQVTISSIGRDSQEAFYAADSGAECAIFWDVKNPTNPGASAFATTTAQNISCNNTTINGVGGPSNSPATFRLDFVTTSGTYCADVTVTKSYAGNLPTTKIESKGYNTCDVTATQRVERAIRITY